MYKDELENKKKRLALYLAREEKMLTDGVQSYGIGSRNVSRYQTDLANIRAAIKELEKEIKALENIINRKSPNRSYRVIASDY
mgnify:CR=1 FL=1